MQNVTLEESEGCKYDSIVVSDTKNVSLDRSARICGTLTEQIPNSIETRYLSFYIKLFLSARTLLCIMLSNVEDLEQFMRF